MGLFTTLVVEPFMSSTFPRCFVFLLYWTFCHATCISLLGSRACPAFGTAMVSTNVSYNGRSFLRLVNNVQQFDEALEGFMLNDYSAQRSSLYETSARVRNESLPAARYSQTLVVKPPRNVTDTVLRLDTAVAESLCP